MTDRDKDDLKQAAKWSVFGLAVLLTLGYVWCWLGYRSPLHGKPSVAEPAYPAWQSVKARVEAADQQSKEALNKRLADVSAFFSQRASGSDGFAKDVLSLGGKWELMKSKVVGGTGHDDLLVEAFAKNLFTPDELQAILQSAVRGFLADLDAIENDLLVSLMADIADGELGRTSPHLRSNPDSFKREYARVADELRPALARDFHLFLGREIASNVFGDLAVYLSIRVGASLATEMGISTSILGSGLVAGAATVGLAVVTGLIVDAILDKILRLCGHDPEAAISQVMCNALKDLDSRLIKGNPSAVSAHETLRYLAENDGIGSVRDAARKAIPQVEMGGQLGLRWELTNLHAMRAQLRRQALQKFLTQGGGG